MSIKISGIDELTCLESGVLPVHGGGYSLVLLKPQHINAILALNETVISQLPADQKSFVLQRDRAYFESHFRRSHGSAVMGVVNNGCLIAKCLIIHPARGETEATLGGTIPHHTPEDTSIMQSLTVDAGYRGNGIMNTMIRQWLNHATLHGRIHVQAEIETRNERSWSKFLKAGMHIVGTHKSPVDGANVYNATERIKYTLVKEVSAEKARVDKIGFTPSG